jgi:HSP20 family molecular chaperone IbpA
MFFAATHPRLHRNVYASAGHTLERFLDQARAGSDSTATRYSQDESSFTLALDMPGISKDQIGVTIDGAVVRLQSKEGAQRQYRAAFELPLEIDVNLSQAKLENGVLTLKLAKKLPVSTAAELAIQ